jgi:hypothetical protein
MGVDFTVEKAPSRGGRVALSRIAWPGYRVDGATMSSKKTDGFLMTLDVAKGTAGRTVHVAFVSPGAIIEETALILIALVTVLWVIGRARPWRRSRRHETALSRLRMYLRSTGVRYD